jgi:uncharacterized protein (TIGR03435 family)
MFASPQPGGGFLARNATVAYLLNMAYGVNRNTILDAPDWVHTEYFDVEGKYETDTAAERAPSWRLMLQSLLRDRFALAATMEKRERPIYALRLARRDGRLGPRLQRSSLACDAPEAAKQLRERGATGANGEPPCALRNTAGAITAGGVEVRMLAGFLGLDRPVHDQTGLSGLFDITLRWDVGVDPLADQSALYTALEDQLGLKIEAATAPLDVLVVRSISRPTPN